MWSYISALVFQEIRTKTTLTVSSKGEWALCVEKAELISRGLPGNITVRPSWVISFSLEMYSLQNSTSAWYTQLRPFYLILNLHFFQLNVSFHSINHNSPPSHFKTSSQRRIAPRSVGLARPPRRLSDHLRCSSADRKRKKAVFEKRDKMRKIAHLHPLEPVASDWTWNQ